MKKISEFHLRNFEMKKTKIYLTFILCFLIQSAVAGQPQSTDFFRSIGKIYVVVAVLVTVFIGIIIFLIYLERRIKKLEKQRHE